MMMNQVVVHAGFYVLTYFQFPYPVYLILPGSSYRFHSICHVKWPDKKMIISYLLVAIAITHKNCFHFLPPILQCYTFFLLLLQLPVLKIVFKCDFDKFQIISHQINISDIIISAIDICCLPRNIVNNPAKSC